MRIIVSRFYFIYSSNFVWKQKETQTPIRVIDPSELLRPETAFAQKPIAQFRDYTVDKDDPIKERVRKTYHDMHTNQTVDFVQGKPVFKCALYWLSIKNELAADPALKFRLSGNPYVKTHL